MVGFVQEPTKDTVPIRDLFTVRVCLRITSAGQVDGVLGEDARLRGALADEIPNVLDTAGIGYVVRPRTRTPMRVRTAYVDVFAPPKYDKERTVPLASPVGQAIRDHLC